ncbi:unnamed protein product [Rhodiola kirilowii]
MRMKVHSDSSFVLMSGAFIWLGVDVRRALHNLLRHGDVLTLLHVFFPPPPSPRSARKLQMLRLNAFQLMLSFKDICCLDFPNMLS